MTYLGEAPRVGDIRQEGYRQMMWTGAGWAPLEERLLRLVVARRALARVADMVPDSAMLAAIDALLKEATA